MVAVGCLAERYGNELADSLPEADAVLGFDDYADVAERLQAILAGERHQAHVPRDRRTLLPLAPVARQRASAAVAIPGHGSSADLAVRAPASGPRSFRRRLDGGPSAPLKIASGCDRRCTFCAIPAFRGAYVSRTPAEVVAEARWLVEQGVREVFLVSENSSSYGKDLGDIRALEGLLARPLGSGRAGLGPGLLPAAGGDAPEPGRGDDVTAEGRAVLRPVLPARRPHGAPPDAAIRRPDSFLELIDSIRRAAPAAGIRSNVILGFPGETDADVAVLSEFLIAAELDAIGVFGYSDEDGTERRRGSTASTMPSTIEERRDQVADLVDELITQRAEARVGSGSRCWSRTSSDGVVGRAAHQGPEVDGTVRMTATPTALGRGDLVPGLVRGSDGADLVAEMIAP